MMPSLHIKLAGSKVSSFHFFGAVGFIAGTILGIALALLLGLNPVVILFMSAIGGVVFFGLAFIAKWITGRETIVYYHHEVAIISFCCLALYLLKMPLLSYLDITLTGIGAFLAFGRIGCYSVGCCHGRPWNRGVKYGQAHVDEGFTWYYKDIPLMPVQLIEALYVLAIVAINVLLLLRHAVPGTVIIYHTVAYGLLRYILEFFRGDADRPLWSGISEAQWTTLALMLVTCGCSIAGWLPFYGWHMIITGLIAVTSLTIAFYVSKKENYILFTSPHVMQLAEALLVLENESTPAHSKQVDVHTTGSGLCLSCGKYDSIDKRIEHYAISLDTAQGLDTHSVKRIATQIGLLKHYPAGFDIVSNGKGIYHILFTLPQPASVLAVKVKNK